MLSGEDAIWHLLKVGAGLDSLIIGNALHFFFNSLTSFGAPTEISATSTSFLKFTILSFDRKEIVRIFLFYVLSPFLLNLLHLHILVTTGGVYTHSLLASPYFCVEMIVFVIKYYYQLFIMTGEGQILAQVKSAYDHGLEEVYTYI